MKSTALAIKSFVPASDLEVSKQYYLALGFEIRWSSGDLAHVAHGQTGFPLQAFAHPAFIKNYQMHLLVDDVDAWHANVLAAGVVERFGVRLGQPEDRPWGQRDFTLFDPSGVLWRVAQNAGPAT